MIQVTIGNNLGKKPIIIDENTTLREAFEQQNIDYSRGMTLLDGSSVEAGGLDKSFKDYGVTKSCFLLNIVKTDNAA